MEEVSAVSFYFDHLFFVHSSDSDSGNMDIVVLVDEIPDAVHLFLIFRGNRPANIKKNASNCE